MAVEQFKPEEDRKLDKKPVLSIKMAPATFEDRLPSETFANMASVKRDAHADYHSSVGDAQLSQHAASNLDHIDLSQLSANVYQALDGIVKRSAVPKLR